MYTHDVIVLGGGPAGGAVAAPLARKGKNVAMIETEAYGGACPLRGCNPKKVLMAGAEAVHMAEIMRPHGVTGQIGIDWPALMRFKQSFVDPVPESAKKAYANMGIDTRLGKPRFTGPNSVEVNGVTLSAPHICICVGLKPASLPVPGGDSLPISDDFLNLESMPQKVALIGGGFIAFEFAHIARQAGADVTIINRSDRVLRQFDHPLTVELIEASRRMGIDVRMEHPVHHVEKDEKSTTVYCGDNGQIPIQVDIAFNCTGRTPAIDGLNLDAADIEHGRRGITVDSGMQSTSNPAIFAIGDVASHGPALTPTATIQGKVAAANIIKPGSREVDYTGIPSACFTLPPLTCVGLTEAEAEKQKLSFDVKELDLADSFPWKRMGEKTGRSRVLIDENNDRILGAHILGHNAEEMINIFALAIRHAIPLSEMRSTVWAYPTCGYYVQKML